MSDATDPVTRFKLAELSARKPARFHLEPDDLQRDAMARELGIEAVRKLSFQGQISAQGKAAWRLEAKLGATAVQSCVVTLAPVVMRVDILVSRLFTEDFDDTITGEDVEMPEDDTIEPLRAEIDLIEIARESLALALPDYPRAEGAELEKATFTAPDVTPMSDDDVKPFAGLADLKKKLETPDGE